VDFNKIIARVKNILLTPKTEWPVIAGEPETVASLYTNYILILAAIPAICGFIKMTVFGMSVPFVGTIRVGFFSGLTQMILTYAVSLGITFLVGLIIDFLAPTFGGQKNQVQALKTAAYGYTASWVAGIFYLLPGLGWLIMLAAGIYCIYQIYLGLPNTMQCPPEKAGGYTAVTIIIAIVLSWILMAIVGVVSGVGALGAGAMSGANMHSSTTFTPDNNSALGALAAMGKRAEEAGKKMDQAQKSGDTNAQAAAAGQMIGAVLGGGSQVEALSPDALKVFIPETLAGLPRKSFTVERQAPIGVQVSTASATYNNGSDGSANYELTVSDMGGAKGLMALAGFANVEEDKQNDQGYEKTYHQNGRLIHEQWDKNGSGEYTIVLGDRFVVAVKGQHVADVEAVKAALGGVNLSGLEALKNQGVKNG